MDGGWRGGPGTVPREKEANTGGLRCGCMWRPGVCNHFSSPTREQG